MPSQLDVPDTAQERRGLLIFERRQSAADGILCPALRVALLGVFKEAVKSGKQIGQEVFEVSLRREIGGFGDDVIVLVFQQGAKRGDAGFIGLVPQLVESSKLRVEILFPGHGDADILSAANCE